MIIPKTIESYSDVPGFNNDTHLDNLMSFASSIPEGSKVLEIGCAWGGSTWALLDSLPKNCNLHVCDTFGMNHPQLKQKHFNGVMKKHSHNTSVSYAMNLYLEKDHRSVFDWCLKQHPRFKKVVKQVHQRPSLELLAEDSEWDFVYIDGGHSYETVKHDYEQVKDSKLIVFDDVKITGVNKFVKELIADGIQIEIVTTDSKHIWGVIRN